MGISTATSRVPTGADGAHAEVTVVHLDGELDISTAAPLRGLLRSLLRHDGAAGAPRVVVDLQEVTFMDSYALGVLVQGHRLARAHKRTFAVVSTRSSIDQLFRVTGMHHVLPLHRDLQAALAQQPPARVG